MADFNADDYFANRRRLAAEAEVADPVRDRVLRIEAATAANVAKLEELGTIQQQRLEANRESVVGTLGLDPDGITGSTVNLGARLLSGASKNVIAPLLAIPSDIREQVYMKDLDQEDRAAGARYDQGKATPADLARLNETAGVTKNAPNAGSKLDSWQEAKTSRSIAKGFRDAFDIDYITHKGNTTRFDDELRKGAGVGLKQLSEGWEVLTGESMTKTGSQGIQQVISGLGNLLVNAGAAAANNPMAAGEYITENLGQLAVGMGGKIGQVLLGMTNAGYAFDNYNKGIEAYRAKNDGQFPPPERMQEMAIDAASLALAEHVGDAAQLGLGKSFNALTGKGGKEVIAAVAKEGDSFIKSIGKSGLATLGAAATEAATEGYQTRTEGEILGKPASLEDIYVGATIGAVAGGGLTGTTRVAGDLAKAGANLSKDTPKTDPKVTEAVTEAVKTGDVAALLDQTSPTYAPDKAINALHGNSKLDETTPETVQKNLEQANEIVTGLEERLDQAKGSYASISPEGIAANKTRLAEAQAALATEVDPAEVQKLTELTTILPEVIRNAEANSGQLAKMQSTVTRLENQFAEASKVLEAFTTDAQAKLGTPKVDVAAEVAIIKDTAAAPEVKAASATRILNLSMAAPESLDPALASELANDAANGLSEAHRGYLRAFSDARVAENTLKNMKSVSQDIYFGNEAKRMVGIAEYRSNVTQALSVGNKRRAEQQLGQLVKFEQDHKAKADLAEATIDAKPGAQIIKVNGAWQVNTGKRLSDPEMKKNGGVTLNSRVLVNDIRTESNALSLAVSELQQAVSLKFPATVAAPAPTVTPTTSTSKVSNVKNQSPKQGPGVQGSPVQGAQAPSGSGEGASGSAGSAGPVQQPAAAQPGLVQDAGATVGAGQSGADAAVTASTAVTSVDQAPIGAGRGSESSVEGQNQSTNTVDEDLQAAADQAAQDRTDVFEFEEFDESQVPPEFDEEVDLTAVDAGPPIEVEDGGISTLLTKSPEGTSYTERNLLADYFTQAVGEPEGINRRPLVAIKSFGSAVLTGAVKVADFLPKGMKTAAVDRFMAVARGWAADVGQNLPPIQPQAFRYQDMMQFFMTGTEGKSSVKSADVDIDENVKLAIVAAAYTWAGDAARSPRYQKADGINALLGRPKESRPTPEMWDKLSQVQVYQHILVDSLGGSVINALGLKPTKDAPQDLVAKLRSALGMHALKLLEDHGLITRTTIPAADITRMRTEGLTDWQLSKLEKMPVNTEAVHTFFSVARSEDGKVVEAVEGIFQSIKGSQDVLGKLFGLTHGLKKPSLEPITSVQQSTQGTSQGVPQDLQEIVLANQSKPRVVRTDPLDLFGKMDPELVLGMMGVVEESDETTHVSDRLAVLAKNDALRREWSLFQEFVGEYLATSPEGLKTPFYLPFAVWEQQRVGIASTMVNPQTSKIHRFLIGSPSWDTTIEFSNQELMDSFYLRVAEGLGVKTERKDNSLSIKDIKDKLATPTFKLAIEALRKAVVLKQDISAEEQADIAAAVKAGGEKLHSLDGLIGLAHMAESEASGKPSFTVQMMGEVDGVVNGTMLNHVLFGSASSSDALNTFLNRGGFYEEGSEYTQYNQYRGKPGHLDIYEGLAQGVNNTMANFLETEASKTQKQWVASIWKIGGNPYDEVKKAVSKEGRDLIKEALNPLNFGAGMTRAIQSMADNMTGKVTSGFAKMAVRNRTEAVSQEEIDAYVGHINALIRSADHQLPVGKPLKFYMETALSTTAEAQIQEAYKATVGKVTEKVMKQEFASFLAGRNTLNGAINLTYDLYDAVYQGQREAFIAALIAEDKVPFRINQHGAKELIGDLSKNQEAELTKRMKGLAPILRTVMSKNDKKGDGTDASGRASGLMLADTDRVLSPNKSYENIVKFGRALVTGDKSAKIKGYTTVTTQPGVKGGSMATHSTDSAISHWTQRAMDLLNIHDAVGTGVGMLKQAAQLMNQNTWKATLNYSPMGEAYLAQATVVRGIASMYTKGELSTEAIANLAAVVEKYVSDPKNNFEEGTDPFEAMLVSIKSAAIQADRTKLGAMARWAFVDQYAFQGGNYVVTPEDRAEAKKLMDGLDAELSAADLKAIEQLKDLGSSKTTDAPAAPTPTAPATPAPTVSTASGRTVFGELGKSKKDSNPELVAFFKENPVTTVSAVLTQLRGMLKKEDGYQRLLMDLLAQGINGDMKVQLITPQSTQADVKATPVQSSFGWFVDNEIYVLNEDFVNSGLQTSEVLLHEMTHGAIAQVVEDALAAKSGPAFEAVQRLQALMEQANKAATAEEQAKFGSALTDVHEFIAYGMTRKSFQGLLARVTVEDVSKTNGFTAFVKRLVGVLFASTKSIKTSRQQAETALAMLIRDVSGLVNQAAIDKTAPWDDQAPSINLSMAAPSVRDINTLEIFDALGLASSTLTPAFDAKLRYLLDGIVDKLHGPFGSFGKALMENTTLTPFNVWLKAIRDGAAPFASEALQAPLVTSAQEAFVIEQVEATVLAALEDNGLTAYTYGQLGRLYTEARKKLSPKDFHGGDWSAASANEQLIAQQKYDFIFKMPVGLSKDRQSRYLARFAALGMAHQEVSQKLGFATDLSPKLKTGKTIADKIQMIVERILSFFGERILHTYGGQQADTKLATLVGHLVDLEAKKREQVAKRATSTSLLDPVTGLLTKGTDKAKDAVMAAAGSNFVRNSKNAFVRGGGAAVRIVAGDRVDLLMDTLGRIRDKQFKGRHGFIAGMVNTVRGPAETFISLLRQAKLHEGIRKDIIANTGKFALEAFKNGTDMADEVRASIAVVFMRTGLHHLFGPFNLNQIETIISDDVVRMGHIDTYERQLFRFGSKREYFIRQAKALGYYKATGHLTLEQGVLMNAYNIAHELETGNPNKLSEDDAKAAEATLKVLISLYALQYTDSIPMAAAKQVLATENARPKDEGNGIEFVLLQHKKFEEESLAKLFKGNPILMMHGYTPDIYNPHTDIEVANLQDGKELLGRGYTQHDLVPTDPSDPDQEVQHIYVLEDGGLAPLLTGGISYSGMQAKGNKVHQGKYTSPWAANLQASMSADKQHIMTELYKPGARHWNPAGVHGKYMAPVMNEQGKFANWRYLMSERNKDVLLQRDGRFDRALGVLAGSIYDKQTSREQNKVVFAALKEQYDADFATRSESYVFIGAKSPNQEFRDIWRMLPQGSKDDVREVWNKDGMWVRNDVLDITFGYRKLSLADIFKKDPDARREVEKAFVWLIEHLLYLSGKVKGMNDDEAKEYSTRAAIKVTRAERAWQALVGETKDIVVVKTGVVLWGNFLSNLSQLAVRGVPIKDIVLNHVVALRAATAYRHDAEELGRLEGKLAAGYTQGNGAEIEQRIAELKDALVRNPVTELIEAGMMPTIVEDIAQDDDIYAYKPQVFRKAEEYANKLHPGIKAAGRTLYMAHDTKLYQGLSRLTQLSDFVARYTLYQHNITKKKPMTKAEALADAGESFVNYDIPMHRGMQYLDDMGITYFSKYFLQIQRVLMKMMREHPGRVLTLALFNNFLDLGPIVLDGSFMTRGLNNPLEWGAGKFFGTIDDLATINVPMALVKSMIPASP